MTRQCTIEVPAPAAEVLDTRGASDAFLAAIFLQLVEHQWTTGRHLALLREEQLQELGMFANRVATISCARYGGVQSFPYREDVERV